MRTMPETKEVYFDEYCETCKYESLKGYEDPCDNCLEHPYNYDSHKPIYWEKNEGKKPAKAKN